MPRIGIFDSGIGGMSVLMDLRRLIPAADFVYYADNANCPYGKRSPEWIRERAEQISRELISEGCELIVVACNTATAAAIAYLRERFNIPFVGMEPAVKPAAALTRSGVIGVLATAGTLSARKYNDVKDRYAEGVKVVEHVGEGFVELVERGELSGERAEALVRASLQPLLDAGADTVVLGCTHYPFLLPLMRRIADVHYVNPAPAVARRTLALLAERGPVPEGEGSLRLLCSDPETIKWPKINQTI